MTGKLNKFINEIKVPSQYCKTLFFEGPRFEKLRHKRHSGFGLICQLPQTYYY